MGDPEAPKFAELSLFIVRLLTRTLALCWFLAFSQGNWYCFDIVRMVLDFGMSALFKEQETCACWGVIMTDRFPRSLVGTSAALGNRIGGCKCFGFCVRNQETLWLLLERGFQLLELEGTVPSCLEHFRCCWDSVSHMVPLNTSNSQTALKGKNKTNQTSPCFRINLLLRCWKTWSLGWTNVMNPVWDYRGCFISKLLAWAVECFFQCAQAVALNPLLCFVPSGRCVSCFYRSQIRAF